jgi:hypothetical protein
VESPHGFREAKFHWAGTDGHRRKKSFEAEAEERRRVQGLRRKVKNPKLQAPKRKQIQSSKYQNFKQFLT